MLRMLRGLVRTALTWAIPWALAGGTFLTVAGAISLSTVGSVPLRVLASMFANGALLSGIFGALAGGVFAATVAISERRSRFADLSYARMLAWGAVGGGAVALGAISAIGLLGAGVIGSYWPGVVLVSVSSVLGAGSASGTLALARRGRDEPEQARLAGSGD